MDDLGCHDVEPVFNPEAVRDYYSLESYGIEKEVLQDLIMKAKQHLAAVGWTFRYIFDKFSNRNKVKYVPPDGKRQQTTLKTACKFYLDCENGGVEEVESADKCGKKRKARCDDEIHVGKNEVRDFERKDEEYGLCLDNRQFSFEDFEKEDGVIEVQRRMRALHLENGEFKVDDSESEDSGKTINVGKTKLNCKDGNQKMDNVVEVQEISEEEEIREINFRKFKKKKVRFVEELLDVGKSGFNALEKRKKRITACDLYGERMLRCMQGN
ncbi:hypothetical protein POM88_002670 [Heracleum sosnowskyi]|uniref:DUF7028 domain-containing protein n=1 Tax=Heracleum sosnowskyi TaxID=360622 RepID=A0AAD8N643_9APIA|nr:hypothetical protein POM88_002670 [Heracleum sosnowskyi]